MKNLFGRLIFLAIVGGAQGDEAIPSPSSFENGVCCGTAVKTLLNKLELPTTTILDIDTYEAGTLEMMPEIADCEKSVEFYNTTFFKLVGLNVSDIQEFQGGPEFNTVAVELRNCDVNRNMELTASADSRKYVELYRAMINPTLEWHGEATASAEDILAMSYPDWVHDEAATCVAKVRGNETIIDELNESIDEILDPTNYRVWSSYYMRYYGSSLHHPRTWVHYGGFDSAVETVEWAKKTRDELMAEIAPLGELLEEFGFGTWEYDPETPDEAWFYADWNAIEIRTEAQDKWQACIMLEMMFKSTGLYGFKYHESWPLDTTVDDMFTYGPDGSLQNRVVMNNWENVKRVVEMYQQTSDLLALTGLDVSLPKGLDEAHFLFSEDVEAGILENDQCFSKLREYERYYTMTTWGMYTSSISTVHNWANNMGHALWYQEEGVFFDSSFDEDEKYVKEMIVILNDVRWANPASDSSRRLTKDDDSPASLRVVEFSQTLSVQVSRIAMVAAIRKAFGERKIDVMDVIFRASDKSLDHTLNYALVISEADVELAKTTVVKGSDIAAFSYAMSGVEKTEVTVNKNREDNKMVVRVVADLSIDELSSQTTENMAWGALEEAVAAQSSSKATANPESDPDFAGSSIGGVAQSGTQSASVADPDDGEGDVNDKEVGDLSGGAAVIADDGGEKEEEFVPQCTCPYCAGNGSNDIVGVVFPVVFASLLGGAVLGCLILACIYSKETKEEPRMYIAPYSPRVFEEEGGRASQKYRDSFNKNGESWEQKNESMNEAVRQTVSRKSRKTVEKRETVRQSGAADLAGQYYVGRKSSVNRARPTAKKKANPNLELAPQVRPRNNIEVATQHFA